MKATLLFTLAAIAMAAQIIDLPGAPKLSFKMYSGYINVDPAHGRQLFYWFVESQQNPQKDPVVLWLNGGPGCSSLGGLLSEHGPLRPAGPDGKLIINPYSWNQIANVIYLESPAGVGFSFSDDPADYTVGDVRTADDIYAFLQGFFAEFPFLQGNPFWVSGESYGGHYVPFATQRVIQGNQNNEGISINIQGLMVGNAWTDAPIDNAGAVFYWWSHALISDETYQGINSNCDFSNIGPLAKRSTSSTTQERLCNQFLNQSNYEMGSVDIYDIYVDVCTARRERQIIKQMARHGSQVHEILSNIREPIRPPYRPCIDDYLQAYLNEPLVQEALHVNLSLGYKWVDCSPRINYNYTNLLASVIPLYEGFKADGNIRVLVYSGDVDAIVPYSGSRQWISSLGWDILESWRPWNDGSGQVGGYIQVLDGLTFSTVRGAGHMVPEWQPQRAYVMFSSFLTGQPFPDPPAAPGPTTTLAQ